MKWIKRKDAPIPDYSTIDGKYRIYKGGSVWIIQDLTGHERVALESAQTFKEAKKWVQIREEV